MQAIEVALTTGVCLGLAGAAIDIYMGRLETMRDRVALRNAGERAVKMKRAEDAERHRLEEKYAEDMKLVWCSGCDQLRHQKEMVWDSAGDYRCRQCSEIVVLS
jgi:hypothetical protein